MTELFLGLIALATLVMAALQIGVVLYAGRVASRVEKVLARIDRDLEPVMRHLQELGGNATRASALAVGQLERADKLFADAAFRLEATLGEIQRLVSGPAREGLALLAGLRSALAALRVRPRPPAGREPEGEEALFIG